MTNDEAKYAKFAKYIERLMESHDPPMSIREVAEAIDVSDEYIRRLVRGLNTPSDIVANALAGLFGVDPGAMKAKVKSAKFEVQFGKKADVNLFHPEIEALATGWPMLHEDQQKELMNVFKTFLTQNRREAEKKAKAREPKV